MRIHDSEAEWRRCAAVKEATRRYIAGVAPKDLEDLILSCYLSDDFHEGVRAFLEKRKPSWTGR